jgi:hypothetical protein
MKSTKMIVAFLVVFLCASAATVYAQMAPPEGDWYGSEGTLEIGFNGSITLPTQYHYEGEGKPEDDDDGTTTIMLSPFANYFVIDGLHVGGKFIYMGMTNDKSDYEMTLLFFYPTVGYALALTPYIQLDLSLNLGFMTMTYSSGTYEEESSSFSWGFSGMLLFPVVQNAVFGIGVLMAWYYPEPPEGVDWTVTYRSTQIPIYMSIYF